MGDWRREGTGFFDRTHLQFWTFETFRDSFVGTPFEVRRVVAGEPGLPLRPLRRLLPGAASWLDEAVGRTMPNLASSQVLLVAQLNTAPCESSS
jgi:hypothetical protein